LELQKKLQDRLGTLDFSKDIDKTNFIRAHAQYLDQELHEMLRELPFFKSWKQYDWSPTETKERLKNAQEEFIDAFHFMLNIALALGLDAEAIYRIYCYKNNVNHERQDNNY
jgi:dimeric dUTPase (all-alpha-NTP-PPase superfamily)